MCSPDGRHLAIMPHPERAFLSYQQPWAPHDADGGVWRGGGGGGGVGLEGGPWMALFQNAYEFATKGEQREAASDRDGGAGFHG